MKRVSRPSSGMVACAVALALSLTSIVQAQPAPQAATEAQIGASPAAQQLRELIDALNTGDAATIKAFMQTNGVNAMTAPPGPPGALPLAGAALDLHRRSRGFDLLRIASADERGAVAIVRNRLTGDEQGLAVTIEPQAPHRITGFPMVSPATVAAFASPAAAAASEQAQLQQIGSFLRRLADADVFSGVVVIARDGRPVFSQAYGFADRENGVPNTVDTPFLLGSMNKLFTSLAIGQLVEQGKLSYEDPLSRFIPDFPDPDSAGKIKIKHLLSHTSGLGAYWNPTFFSSLDRLRTVQDVLDVAGREPPQFEPGSSWRYSNTGFQLLGRVIEIVTEQDYYDYMRENVFAPAGVTMNMFPHYDRDDIGMAKPYEIEFDGNQLRYVDQTAGSPRRGGPAGGGIASATDLIKLANAMASGRIVTAETLRLHASPKPELASPNYGYGITPRARMARRPLVGHGGNAPGQCTEFGTLTDTPYTIVILSNTTFNTCMSVTGKILQVLSPTSPSGA